MSVYDNYRQIADEFVNTYYQTMDRDIAGVNQMYLQEACISLLGDEMVGFQNYLYRLQNTYSVFRFHHQIHEVDPQPIQEDVILITVTGRVTADGRNYNRFVETFTLVQEGHNQGFGFQHNYQPTFYIRNQIFRMIP